MTLRKRSVAVAGHRTSVSLEPEFWDALRELARQDGVTVGALIGAVDAGRAGNLSSALRLHVLHAAKAGRLPTASSGLRRDR